MLKSRFRNMTVGSCYEKRDMFRFDLSIQRNLVWNKEKKSLFIHSMLLGYPLAKIFTMGQEKDRFYWVLDGKQRLNTFFEFFEGEFALEGEDIEPINGIEVRGKTFEELPDEMRQDFLNINITLEHFKELSREQRDKMFFRLNNGEPLSKMEQTRALSGRFMDQVMGVLGTDLFKNKLRMSEKTRARFKDMETVLQVLMVLEKGEEVEGIGSKNIREYVNEKRFAANNEDVIGRLLDVVSYVDTACDSYVKKELRMFKKANMPVIIKAASVVKSEGMEPEDFGRSLVKFYIEAFDKEGEYANLMKAGSSRKDNVLRRVEILNRFMRKEMMKNMLRQEAEAEMGESKNNVS